MLIGSPEIFAVESGITSAYEAIGQRALGFFVIHIAGQQYGIREPDASLLACSFEEIQNTLKRRGTHVGDIIHEIPSNRIVDAFLGAVFDPNRDAETFFGMSGPEFANLIYSNQLVWAPDGDEAFDDGSYILRIDINDQVRLIGFHISPDYRYDPKTLTDITLSGNDFYGVLEQWREDFLNEWTSCPKEDAHSKR